MTKKSFNTESIGNAIDFFAGESTTLEPAAGQTAEEKRKEAKRRTAAVYLTAGQFQQLDAIAQELGTNRHAVMQYAIRKFLEGWAQGERPEKIYKAILK